MSKVFKGRPVVAGAINGKEAVVTHTGFNTLASFQKSALKKAKQVICSDQNNPELYEKNLTDRVICLPKTIGSTTGGMVLYSVCALNIHPCAMLFSETIDSLAAAGVVLADIWTDSSIVAVDNLGDEFLNYVKDGMKITVSEDGTVTVD
ncbi:MAG: DUF126 domain-containing protein [Clostridia bacterium]|nr:DUF126 domain-containing protein [Clostridia bacterium]